MKNIWILGSLSLAFAHGPLTNGSGPPAQPEPAAPTAPPDAPDLSKLSIDELIKVLPLSGNEWMYDRTSKRANKDPAAEEMARRLANEKLTDDQWRAALLSVGALRFRDRVPKDADYAISMSVPRWLGVAQIRVKPRLSELRAVEAGELMSSWSGTWAMINERDARLGRPMGRLPEGVKEIVFDIEVERGTSWAAAVGDGGKKEPPPGVLWKGVLERSVKIVESYEEALPGAGGGVIDEGVRAAIGAGFREWGPDKTRVPFLLIDPDCLKYPALEKMALDIKVELLHNDKVLAESWLVASDADRLTLIGSLSKARAKFYGSCNFDIADDHSKASEWKIRLTGGSEHLWCMWHADHHWNGAMTISWDDAVKNEEQRVGPEGRGPTMSTPYLK